MEYYGLKTDLRNYWIEKLSYFPQNDTCFEKNNAIINNEHVVSAFVLQVPCDDEKSSLFKKIHVEIVTKAQNWTLTQSIPGFVLFQR